MNHSDIEIIAGIKSGDRAILNAFYKMHFEMICHYVVTNGGDDQEAKDIYQEGVLVIFEKIRADKLELSCKLKTFLYSICRNLWLKQLDRKGKFVGKIEEHEEYIIPEEGDSDEMNEQYLQYNIMREALDNLGEPCKMLINDFYINNLSMNNLTEKFGYSSEDSAKSQKYKCMNRLKKIFFDLYKGNSN